MALESATGNYIGAQTLGSDLTTAGPTSTNLSDGCNAFHAAFGRAASIGRVYDVDISDEMAQRFTRDMTSKGIALMGVTHVGPFEGLGVWLIAVS